MALKEMGKAAFFKKTFFSFFSALVLYRREHKKVQKKNARQVFFSPSMALPSGSCAVANIVPPYRKKVEAP
jgi:hypothetical protein